jgi:GDP/UDP-N,N'-diacetylbacillosamine 2-epimerase (hydrolysing)
MSVKRKIMIVSGTRADYGLLKKIICEVHTNVALELQLIVTGSHLSKAHGYTVSEIESDSFPIAHRVTILDESNNVSVATARALEKISNIITEDRPDIVLVLGDRYESFAAATAALLNNVLLAHIHGGELTLGAIDDAFRHAMTKMAMLHFTSAEEYRKRVIHLGEAPERVFNVGAPAVDSLESSHVPIAELEEVLGIKLVSPVVLATFHPETHSPGKSKEHLLAIWEGLKSVKTGSIVFTKANSDAEGNIVNTLLTELINKKEIPNCILVPSLGHRRYLGLLRHADVGLGNSSSLVIEAPMVGTPSVNIGHRQDGRIRSDCVIDVEFEPASIARAITTAYALKKSKSYKPHPFGEPGVAGRIVKILANYDLPKNLMKAFYD